MASLTLTAYAKRRGVSPVAVSKAVRTGRLSGSVVRDERGVPAIADPDLADQEWTANTRQRADRPLVERNRRGTPDQQSDDGIPGQPIVRAGAIPASDTSRDEIPPYNQSQAVRAYHAARREAALADQAEFDRDERRGQLVDAEQARRDVIARYSTVRALLLGVPSALGQRMPDLAARVVPVADELVRAALQELAVDGDAG